MKILEVVADVAPQSGELPPDVAAAFNQVGEMQRGEPELIMVQAQRVIGGGVMATAIEHVGDIIHRMTRQGPLMRWGLDAAAEKIEKTHRWLHHGYGFEREFLENLQGNAEFKKVPVETLREQTNRVLRRYADAHKKLPVYNRAQFFARTAAMTLGLQEFQTARSCLSGLLSMVEPWETWVRKNCEFQKDAEGRLLQFPYRNR